MALQFARFARQEDIAFIARKIQIVAKSWVDGNIADLDPIPLAGSVTSSQVESRFVIIKLTWVCGSKD